MVMVVVEVDSGSTGAEGVAAEPQRRLTDGVIKWEEVRSLPPESAVSSPPKPPWSMVAIKSCDCESPFTIFPPINHENLLISPDPPLGTGQIPLIVIDDEKISFWDSGLDSDSGSNSTSTFSPVDSSPAPCSPLYPAAMVIPPAGEARWFGSWTDLLRSRVAALFRLLSSSFNSSRGIFVTFRSVGFTALVVAFWYFRRRRRLRVSEQSLDGLTGMIKERDEKINQLLDQISRMNQILLELHRVPSSSTS